MEEKAIEAENIVKTVICEECGSEMPMELETCTNCGCPLPKTKEPVEDAAQKVEVTAVNLQMKKSTKKYIIIAIVAIVVIAAIAMSVISSNVKKNTEQYYNTMKEVSSALLSSAAEAEDVGNLIKAVWSNSINRVFDKKTDKYTVSLNGRGSFYDDFNEALACLFKDSDFKDAVNQLEKDQERATVTMRGLKNPPEEYEDAYEAMKEYYNSYIELTNLVIDPRGSLQSFSNDFSNAVSKFVKCYNALDLYVVK